MKLIDTSSFVEFLKNLEEAGAEHVSFGDLRKFIYEQRTAYDVDKIIKKFQELKEECSDPLQEYEPEYFIDRAIEIVKSGGVDNSD